MGRVAGVTEAASRAPLAPTRIRVTAAGLDA
jgi:hypothetical protein